MNSRQIPRPIVSRMILCLVPALLAIPQVLAQEATRFQILQCDHATILEVRDGSPGGTAERYALVRHNAPFVDDGSYAAVITIPVRRIAVLSSSILPHLEDLGVLDTLVAVDDRRRIYNRQILSRIEEGLLPEVGGGARIDRERIIAARPDLVLYSPVGTEDATVAALDAAGIPVISLADWREPTPLARLQWIRVVGALTERTAQAEAILQERSARYAELRDLTRRIPADRRPRVLVNAPWRGQWPVPPADSYVAQFIEDAGGRYLWEDLDAPATEFLDFETVVLRAAAAEVWINLNAGWNTPGDLIAEDPRLASMAPFASGHVYHYGARERASGANDFWESGAAHPEIVLADLIRIFHPELLPDHRLFYYRSIFP